MDAEDRAGWEAVDHTADLAVRVWAPDLAGLFRQAAVALAHLLAGGPPVEGGEPATLVVTGIDLEELLVGWLNEILYRIESEGLLLQGITSMRISEFSEGYCLEVDAGVAPLDGRVAPVKAATYHGLKIDPGAANGYDLTIVFDT